MKKFLSLVLALVMTMSLVTISAGAKDFTDADKVNYTEAVDVMSAVKVIDGYTDGSFNPQGTLTRGAAAKIICNLILGPTTAAALKADTAPFKDVPTDHTFAGYIAFCAKEGIISGYADGTFRPGNTLTGYAFMKMLLGALGYDKAVEGYEGANWSINVAKRALNIGLDDGLVDSFDGTKAVTREQACLFALNTLKADMVEYDAKTSVSIGGAEVVIAGSKAQPVTTTSKSDTIKDEKTATNAVYTVQFGEKYFSDLTLKADTDDFGRPANTWKLKKELIGTFSKTADATYTKKVKKSDVYEVVGKSVYDDLKDGESTLTVYFDGEKTVVAKADIDKYIEKNNSGAVMKTGNGDLTEIFIDSANNVTIVVTRTYLFQAVGDYDTKKETLTLGTPDAENADTGANSIVLADKVLDVDDFPGIEDFKDEDYILVTAVKNDAGKYEVMSLQKAEIVEGTVNGYKDADNVEIEGTTYSYSAYTKDGGIKTTSYTVGQKAAVILDAYGYVIGVKEAIVLSDYVFIEAFGSTSSLNTKAIANAVFTDGTREEIVVKKVIGVTDKAAIAKMPGGFWYTFSKNSSGEYTLYDIEKKYTQADADYAAGSKVSYNNKVDFLAGQTYLANDDTVFVVSDKDDKLTVYTGVKNAPEISTLAGSAKVSLLHKDNNYAALVYIDLTGTATISGEQSANLVYVTKYDGKHVTTNNDVYYTYKVLVDGEEEVVKADNKINGLDSNIYTVVNYVTKNSDDVLTGFEVAKTNGGVVVAGKDVTTKIVYSAGTLNIGGVNYVVTEDAAIDLIVLKSANELNKDEDASYEVAANISAKELYDTLKNYNVKYDFALKTTEAGKKVLTELYVTVTDVITPAEKVTVTTKLADGTVLDTKQVVKGENYEFAYASAGNTVAVDKGEYKDGKITLANVTADTTITVTLTPIPAETVTLKMEGYTSEPKVWDEKGTKELTVNTVSTIDGTYYTFEAEAGTKVIVASGEIAKGNIIVNGKVTANATAGRLPLTLDGNLIIKKSETSAALISVTVGNDVALSAVTDGTTAVAPVKVDGNVKYYASGVAKVFTVQTKNANAVVLVDAGKVTSTDVATSTKGADQTITLGTAAAKNIELQAASKVDQYDVTVKCGADTIAKNAYVVVGTKLTLTSTRTGGAVYATRNVADDFGKAVPTIEVDKDDVVVIGGWTVKLGTGVKVGTDYVAGDVIAVYNNKTIAGLAAVDTVCDAIIDEPANGVYDDTAVTDSTNITANMTLVGAVQAKKGSGVDKIETLINDIWVTVTDYYVVPGTVVRVTGDTVNTAIKANGATTGLTTLVAGDASNKPVSTFEMGKVSVTFTAS